MTGPSESAAMDELRGKVSVARDAGLDSLCLRCQRGFNGDTCLTCWPPSSERLQQALGDLKYVAELKPVDIYAWLCTRLGATTDDESARRWFAVRDALSAAVQP